MGCICNNLIFQQSLKYQSEYSLGKVWKTSSGILTDGGFSISEFLQRGTALVKLELI